MKTICRGQKLPVLKNIKQGNSLIDDLSVAVENAFKWEEEFKEVMQEGGFDVVIGNPPYISVKELPKKDKEFYEGNYDFAIGQYDLYTIFIERAYKLLKTEGYFGFIIPDALLSRSNMATLRKFILENTTIKKLFVLTGVFEEQNVASVVLIFKKSVPSKTSIFDFIKSDELNSDIKGEIKILKASQNSFLSLPNFSYNLFYRKSN